MESGDSLGNGMGWLERSEAFAPKREVGFTNHPEPAILPVIEVDFFCLF